MRVRGWGKGIAVATVLLLGAGPATAAVSGAQKCEADKLLRTGKYLFCRLKAEARAVKTGQLADYAKCDAALGEAFAKAETKYGVECPTSGDTAAMQGEATAAAGVLALRLAGTRWVDNGDGTVTDTATGLMWEQKDDAGGIHDQDNLYSWSVSGTAPDGTITGFLNALNGTTSDGVTVDGCFAGHCDWRLPTIVELQSLLLEPYPCSVFPCIDPIFGPIAYPHFYWSSTADGVDPTLAWDVRFSNGIVGPFSNLTAVYARAVRRVP
jgi:hypothetical protein